MSCFCHVLHLLSIQFRILLISHAISKFICHCGWLGGFRFLWNFLGKVERQIQVFQHLGCWWIDPWCKWVLLVFGVISNLCLNHRSIKVVSWDPSTATGLKLGQASGVLIFWNCWEGSVVPSHQFWRWGQPWNLLQELPCPIRVFQTLLSE